VQDIFETSGSIKTMTQMKEQKLKCLNDIKKISEGASRELKAVLVREGGIEILNSQKNS
jgi:hypothetical protein